MKKLGDLSLRFKFTACFTLILLAMVIVGWQGIAGMNDINNNFNSLKEKQFLPGLLINTANQELLYWNRAILNHVLAESSEKKQDYENIMAQHRKALLEDLANLGRNSHVREEDELGLLLRKINAALKQAIPIKKRVIALSHDKEQAQAGKLLRTALRPLVEEIDIFFTDFIMLHKQHLDDRILESDALYQQGFLRIIMIVMAALSFSVLISFFLLRLILHRVNDLVAGAGFAAAGDFIQAQRTINSQDEFGYLGSVFNDMVTNIAGNIRHQQQQAARLKRTLRKLEASNKELEQFAYVASHDLQEPLRSIGSYVQLLERRYRGRLDADADKYISRAVQGVGRMKRLIEDLLVFSRVGTQGQDFQLVDCGQALNETLANLRLAIEESGAMITAESLPGRIWADPSQLRQVFQNLISNAIRFRGDTTPEIHIGAEPLEKSGYPRDSLGDTSGWLFSVRDNGIGIEPEYLERIFVIFQRLHTREEYPGTGIGLAVCKRIVERHHGRIWVESTPGHGTTFFFTIPDLQAGGRDDD